RTSSVVCNFGAAASISSCLLALAWGSGLAPRAWRWLRSAPATITTQKTSRQNRTEERFIFQFSSSFDVADFGLSYIQPAPLLRRFVKGGSCNVRQRLPERNL